MELISSLASFLNRLGMHTKQVGEPMNVTVSIYVVGDYHPRPIAKISERKGRCKFPIDLKRLNVFCLVKIFSGDYRPRPTAKLIFGCSSHNAWPQIKRLFLYPIRMKACVPCAWFRSQGNTDLADQADFRGWDLLPSAYSMSTKKTNRVDYIIRAVDKESHIAQNFIPYSKLTTKLLVNPSGRDSRTMNGIPALICIELLDVMA